MFYVNRRRLANARIRDRWTGIRKYNILPPDHVDARNILFDCQRSRDVKVKSRNIPESLSIREVNVAELISLTRTARAKNTRRDSSSTLIGLSIAQKHAYRTSRCAIFIGKNVAPVTDRVATLQPRREDR